MAAAGTAVTSVETYEAMSEIYLKLWHQLEHIVQTCKWLETREESVATLQDEIRLSVEALSPDPSSILFSDYRNTQEFVLGTRQANIAEAASFCEYLRDTGLRYAQIADAMIPEEVPAAPVHFTGR